VCGVNVEQDIGRRHVRYANGYSFDLCKGCPVPNYDGPPVDEIYSLGILAIPARARPEGMNEDGIIANWDVFK